MQRSTPERVRQRHIVSGRLLFDWKVSVEWCKVRGWFHLSTTLAAFILSIIITCLLLYIVVVRLIPRLAERPFTISTSRGPEACCTASETDNTQRYNGGMKSQKYNIQYVWYNLNQQ